MNPRLYPRDFATFARFHRALERLGPVQEAPPSLTLERFEALLCQYAAASSVEVAERVPAPAG